MALAEAVLGALAALHREQVYHRDVAPDNIMLQADGSPVLLDFGAARRVIGDRRQSLTAIVKPNFAAIEQYADAGALRQGPWTDVYSLGAVLHFCLIGRAPMPATLRVINDELPSLRALRHDLVAVDGTRYDEDFLGAVDSALAVLPEGRPQDAAALGALLRGRDAVPMAARAAALSVMPGQLHVVERASFAPTTELERPDDGAHAVTTAWRTLGDRPEAGQQATGRARRVWPSPAVRRASFGLAALALAGVLVHAMTVGTAQPTVTEATAPAMVVQQEPRATPPAAAASEAAPAPPPRRTPSTVTAGRSLATAAPRAQRAVRTARASCGERNFFSMQFCLDRQCRKAEFARDPECIERLQQQQQTRSDRPF